MPVTTNSLFTAVTEATSGGLSSTWTNLVNVLAEAGQASTFMDNAVPSWWMILDTPDFAAAIPPDASVTDIQITFSASMDGNPGTTTVRIDDVSIAGGTEYEAPGSSLTNTPAVFDLSGDLAFWGITNQQALDFAAGLETMQLRSGTPFGSTNFDTEVQWVKVQITYVSDLVPLPTLF